MTASHKLYPVLLILILVWFFHIPCLHHIIVVYFYILCFWFHQKTDKWQLWYHMYYDGLGVCMCVCVLCSLMVFCGPVGASHRLRYIYHRLLSLWEAEFSEGSEHKETEDGPRWGLLNRLQLACLLDTLLGARRWSEGPGSRVWWWMATLHAMQTVPKSRLPRPGTPGCIGTLKEGLAGHFWWSLEEEQDKLGEEQEQQPQLHLKKETRAYSCSTVLIHAILEHCNTLALWYQQVGSAITAHRSPIAFFQISLQLSRPVRPMRVLWKLCENPWKRVETSWKSAGFQPYPQHW